MKPTYAAWVGSTLLIGIVVVVGLLYLDFFGLFGPDELSRWERGVDPQLLEVPEDHLLIGELADVIHERMPFLLEEGPAAYTQEQANAWADELIPIVERVSGRAFCGRPTIRVADRATLAQMIAWQLYAQYTAAAPGMAGPALQRMVDAVAGYESATYLGMYATGEKVLYLAPTNVRPIMQSEEIDEKLFEPFVKLIIAHELAHALQDQVVDQAKLPAYVQTPDGQEGYRSVIEGQAVFAADLVGRELGFDETVQAASRMMSAGVVSIDEPELDLLWRQAEVQYEEIYLGGRDFIAWHHGQGGVDQVWRILAEPPATASMIANPESYAAGPRLTMRYYPVLKGTETLFGDKWASEWHLPLTGLDLHAHYALLDNEERDRVVGSIDHARKIHFLEVPGPGRASIYLILLRSEEDAAPFYAAIRSGRDRVAGWTYEDLVEPVPGVVADESFRHRHVPDASLDGEAATRHAHARRGRALVDLHWRDTDLSDETVATIVHTIFGRLETAENTS